MDGQDTLAELRSLSKIIHDSINTIEAEMTSNNMIFPSPHLPLTTESEMPRTLLKVERACSLIISAAEQLICSVRSPAQTVISAALQVGGSL